MPEIPLERQGVCDQLREINTDSLSDYRILGFMAILTGRIVSDWLSALNLSRLLGKMNATTQAITIAPYFTGSYIQETLKHTSEELCHNHIPSRSEGGAFIGGWNTLRSLNVVGAVM